MKPMRRAEDELAGLRAQLEQSPLPSALPSLLPAVLPALSLVRSRLRSPATRTRDPDEAAHPAPSLTGHSPAVHAARRLNRAAGVLATSVLLDSAVEHYRGSFRNKAMFTPLVTSALTLGISVHGTADQRASAHIARDVTYVLAALTGLVGTAFHLRNVTKRPGGMVWQNLFYGAPLGAPTAILLSGLLGYYAERVRNNEPGTTPDVFGLPAGRALAVLTSAGLLGTTAEAGLLHFRGAFHNPYMFLPVTMPPIAAALMAETGFGPKDRNRWFTRLWLRLTMLLGFAGVGFHIYGVSRAMGGWRNWRQNVVDGPPIPAPPSFTGLAIAGLAALGLLKDHPDA